MRKTPFDGFFPSARIERCYRTGTFQGQPILTPVTFDAGSIDPLVLQLGEVAGLLTVSGSTVTVDADFFSDPIASIKAIPTQQRFPQLLDLLAALLGATSGNALGHAFGQGGRSWSPITHLDANGDPQQTGCYVVSETAANGTNVIGLGLMVERQADGVTLAPYAFFPLIAVNAAGDISVVLDPANDAPASAIELGFQVLGGSGAFGNDLGISFDGIKLAAALPLNGPPRVAAALVNLRLPGSSPQDRSLLDQIEHPDIGDWIETALSLIAGRVSDQTSAAMLANLLALLGPGPLPAPDWSRINDGTVVQDWLFRIATTHGAAALLLETLYSLSQGTPLPAGGAPDVSGNGTRDAPFAIALGDPAGLTLDFTLAVLPDGGGRIALYPGLRLAGTINQPLNDVAVGTRITGALELVKITVGPGADPVSLAQRIFPTFAIGAELVNPTSGQPLIALGTSGTEPGAQPMTIASVRAGIAFSGGTLTPSFALVGVATGVGTWPSLDLTNFDSDIKLLDQTAAACVQQALAKLTSAATSGSPAAALCTALGLAPPAGFTSANWPAAAQFLLDGGLTTLLANPPRALSAYYAACLAADIGGEPALRHLLPSLAQLLGAGVSAGVTGSGAAADPWRVPIHAAPDGTSCDLAVFVDTDTPRRLHLGLEIGVPIKFGNTTIAFTTTLALLDMVLPAGDGATVPDCTWMPGLSAGLVVSGAAAPLTLPTIAGVTVTAQAVRAGATWRQTTPFAWQAAIAGLNWTASGGMPMSVGDLTFGDVSTNWQNDLAALTKTGLIGLGLGLLQNGGAPGSVLAAGLGLMPDLSASFGPQGQPASGVAWPPGLALPPNWPSLSVSDAATFFTDPWGDLKRQLDALLNGVAAEVFARLVAWAATGTLPPAGMSGSGSPDDPWSAPLGLWMLRATAWRIKDDTGATAIGFGVQGELSKAAAPFAALTVGFRIDLGQVGLTGSASITPRLALQAQIVSTVGKPLVDQSNPASAAQMPLVIDHVVFGVEAFADGVYPRLVFAGTQLPPGSAPKDIVLARGTGGTLETSVAQTSLAALIAAGMDQLSALAAPDFSLLQSLLGLLETIGIVQTGPSGHGVNAGTWSGLMANPDAFLAAQCDSVFEDPATAAVLFQDAATLLGLDAPRWPGDLAALPALLSALALTRATPSGYVPVLSQWVALAAHPVSYLEAQAAALSARVDPRRKLLSEIAALGPPNGTVTAGPLTFGFAPPGAFTVTFIGTTAQQPLPSLAAGASLTLDLNSGALAAALDLSSPAIGQGLSFRYDGDGASLVLTPAGPAPYAFPPLTLYPLPALPTAYLAALGERLPMQLLSVAAGKFISQEVTPRSELATRLLDGLGLLRQDASAGATQVIGLLPLFNNPLTWLLDPSRLGNAQGQFDLAKLGSLLAALPGSNGTSGPSGLSVTRSGDNGLAVTGMPYGLSALLTATEHQGLAVALTLAPSLGVTGHSFAANAAVTFAHGHAPTIGGSANATIPLGAGTTDHVAVAFGADDGFSLSVQGEVAGESFGPVALVPFAGMNALFGSQMQAQLLAFVADRLAQAASGATGPLAGFLGDIAAFGKLLGITDVPSLVRVAGEMRHAPLEWLAANFAGSSAPTQMTGLAGLLGQTFGIAGVSAATGLLQYAPPSGATGRKTGLALNFGSQDGTFGIWFKPRVANGPFSFALDAGVALPPPLAPSAKLQFTLDATLTADLDTATQGRLTLTPAIAWTLQAQTNGDLAVALAAFPIGTGTTSDVLVAALLPAPLLARGDAPATGIDATTWLEQFALRYAAPLLADAALLNNQVAALLAQSIGATQVALGQVLSDAGLLRAAATGGYQLANFAESASEQTWAQIVEGLIGKAVVGFINPAGGAPRAGVVPILPLDGGDSFKLVGHGPNGGPIDYGVSLTLTDIPVGSSAGAKFLLQLGKPMTGENASDNWMSHSASTALPLDLTVYLITGQPDGASFDFHLRIVLGSIGLDVDGIGTQPLVDIAGFTLGAVEPRLALSVDLSAPTALLIGAGVRADGLGLPLGPGFTSDAPNSNPVAQSLLSSNGGSGSSGGDAVNPTISATLGYIDKFYLAFREDGDPSGSGASSIWLPIQRAFGPLHCRRIGVETAGSGSSASAGVMFDGSVALGGLTIDMDKLAVVVPLSDPTDFSSYSLELSGLGVSYSAGSIQISGGLLEVEGGYAGELFVRTPLQSITAFGAFQQVSHGTPPVKDPPSLFAYFSSQIVIGGPPCFFVTGLAAGIGFNRDFIVPAPGDVTTYPLVAWSADPASAPTDPTVALNALEGDIPPLRGGYWIGVGVQFTSFELLNTTALLVVKFGGDFEIDLLGISTLTLPQSAPGASDAGNPYVYAELGMEVVIRPDDGVLMASAILSPNSYVIYPDVHLTGGFAFYSWFKGDHAGDFVVTLGGYNQAYQRPYYYPWVPQLGINWQSGNASIVGGAYFALTPSCVMAGGSLVASYESGGLRAWFSVYTDFLINWHPYYFSADFGFSIGVSYTFHCFVTITITAELSASLAAHGPPFAGEVTVSWSVVSFTVPVGASQGDDGPGVLHWPQFAADYLPKQAQADGANTLSTMKVAGGSLGTAQDGTTWLVDGEHFVLRVESVAPLTAVTLGGNATGVTGAAIGVAPMNVTSITSSLDLAVTPPEGALPVSMVFTPITQGAPKASWGQQGWTALPDGSHLNDPKGPTVPGALIAVTAMEAPATAPTGPPVIALADLLTDADTLSALPLPLPPATQPASRDGAFNATAIQIIAGSAPAPGTQRKASVAATATADQRAANIAAIATLTGLVVADGPLDVLAAEAAMLFQDKPMIGAAGAGSSAPSTAAAVPRLAPMATPPIAAEPTDPVAVAAFLTCPRRGGIAMRAIRRGKSARARAMDGLAESGSLHAGATVLWRIPEPDAPPPALRADGAMPLRVISVTAPDRRIEDRIVAAGAPQPIAFAAATRLIAVTGMNETDEPGAAGWLPDTPLMQIAPDMFVAPGAVVRTQSPLATGRGRWRHADHAAWRGRALAGANRVEVGGGQRRSGWIATRFAQAPSVLSVLLAPPSGTPLDASAARAALSISLRDADSGAPAAIEASDAAVASDHVALCFRVVASPSHAAIAQASAANGWRIIGVTGSGTDAPDAAPAWSGGSTRRATTRLVWQSGEAR